MALTNSATLLLMWGLSHSAIRSCGSDNVPLNIPVDMTRSKVTKQPKTTVKKSSTQNAGHEGIKCHQPNFFQTSSDMSS